MDFLKSCTTNVRVVDDLAKISCEVLTWDAAAAHQADSRSQLCSTIRQLREDNVLCSSLAQKLFVFGPAAEETKASLTTSGYCEGEAFTEQRIQGLLHAIEGSLAYRLSRDGLTHLSPWTWLFPGGDQDVACTETCMKIQLSPRLVSNGALFLSSTIRKSELSLVRADAVRTGVLLAPSGRSAAVCVESTVQSKTVVRNSEWKANVLELLLSEGVELTEDEEWMEVELAQDMYDSRFLWPRRLCFQANAPGTSESLANDEYWKKWFFSSYIFQDPLAAAEEWFAGAARREDSALTDEPVPSEPSGPPTLPDATADLATSPPFNQRAADQQAAMAGIYPTPPDGMLPGTQGTQVPTSDSNPMPSINESSELLPGEEMERLRQSISSSHAPESGGFRRSEDDLFGDMGEIDFGGNEVGDADFDYFDEPDEVTGVEQADDRSGDVDMVDVDHPHDHVDAAQTPHDPVGDRAAATHLAEESQVAAQSIESSIDQEVTGKCLDVDNAVLEDVTALDGKPDDRPERPLSPFGIRERLLPPPIPASTVRAENERKGGAHRSSAFGPLTFNEGLGLAAKYYNGGLEDARAFTHPRTTETNTLLPAKTKGFRAGAHAEESDGSDEENGNSTESSSESETTASDDEPPATMHWESRKRKRANSEDRDPAEAEQALAWMHAPIDGHSNINEVSAERRNELQEILLYPGGYSSNAHLKPRLSEQTIPDNDPSELLLDEDDLLPVDQFFSQLEDLDLVYVAQVVAEQSMSAVPRLLESVRLVATNPAGSSSDSAILSLFEQALDSILPTADACDLAKLALPRDSARPIPSQSGKGPHPVQRPLQRSDSTQQGPDYSPIPPPYIRVQRHGDTVEMLPTALHFWSTLGLSPASGTKDVRVVSILPSNEGLANAVEDFLHELQLIYEANKMGSWKPLVGLNTDVPDGVIVHSESTILAHSRTPENILDTSDAMQAYAAACEWLGKALAAIGHEDADRTILVCIASPFHADRAQQLVCGCFWLLYKAYRDNVPKAHRNAPRSDLVLRILPCDLIASSDGLVVLDQHQYAQLAMEVYDRCPPSTRVATSKDVPPALISYFAAPAVELAMPVARRIPFQLVADPPGDLLHENSVLHLAYALSGDREWMCFSWIDGSGRYARQTSACLRGKSIADVVDEAWERTGEWLRARDVTWRVYIVGCGSEVLEDEASASVWTCWKDVVGSKARRQMLHVTLLSADLDPEVQLKPPLPAPSLQHAGGEKSGQGFLTPVTTPSGASMTVSPDASTAAPPTPAPSDPAVEADGEAHLVDTADESWGLMLAPSFANPSTLHATSLTEMPGVQGLLASGMLFRRGLSDGNTPLDSFAVSLRWDIRVRPNETVDEGPARQAEYTLREVLKLYRHLAVLGKVRGLSGHGTMSEVVPVHVAGALRMRDALAGLLGGD